MEPLTLKFPLSARALANLANDRIAEYDQTMGRELRSYYLPKAIKTIFNQSPVIARALKNLSPKNLDDLVEEISQILWSSPGSLGGLKIERLFMGQGITELEADAFATEVIHLSRFPLSDINFYRQVRNAVSRVSTLIDPNLYSHNFFNRFELPSKYIEKWNSLSSELGAEKFNKPIEIANWLEKVGVFSSTLIIVNNELRKGGSPDNAVRNAENKARETSVSGALTRRYGRFLFTEFSNLDGMGDRYQRKNDSLSSEFKKLKREFGKPEPELYAALKDYYEKLNARFFTLTSERLKEAKTGKQSSYENVLSHKLSLEGRDLEIKADSSDLSPKLIDNFLQLFKLQLEIDPNMKRYEGTTSLNGQSLSISLEKPSPKDYTYLRKFLDAFSKRVEL